MCRADRHGDPGFLMCQVGTAPTVLHPQPVTPLRTYSECASAELGIAGAGGSYPTLNVLLSFRKLKGKPFKLWWRQHTESSKHEPAPDHKGWAGGMWHDLRLHLSLLEKPGPEEAEAEAEPTNPAVVDCGGSQILT